MNRCVLAVIALSLCLLPLRAQEAKESTERTEDIEVLRRILNMSLGISPKPAPASVTFFNVGSKTESHGGTVTVNPNLRTTEFIARPVIAPLDGIYLKGHGVVYTMKIPVGATSSLVMGKEFGLSETCAKCHSLDVVPKAAVETVLNLKESNKPYIEWLRTQDELRGRDTGYTPTLATDVPICEPGKITARVTEKLFHNQHHVRHVPEGESFSIVVTYEGYPGLARNRVTTTAADAKDSSAEIVDGGLHVAEAQQIRLGDLHLKNKNYDEAFQAYSSGLRRFTKPKIVIDLGAASRSMTVEENMAYEQKMQKMLSAAFLSQAEACAKMKLDVSWATKYHKNAQDQIDSKLIFATEMSQQLTITIQPVIFSPNGGTGIAVPTKLVLSFKRSDVTNSLVDFKKIVQVETIGFPPADPKPTPAKK